ncbi:bifunctional 23S rRNA (guanine(2069)-N(7))-methyltransferase RlmK/23S rRNA (guanine(2445)-N(2))-methyltransferase RlmL [Pseudidiomarina sp. 1APP75-32.1]|uniref:Ribosomal RNA large subunit methyltransferase K/L n=1 Tax=Pseudidiomarina terrestris TaxID=2820060 RepID=A0AAW7QZF8_9GAMM|nr:MULTISPECIES: bifunctional 23S rRNA (guanine(2069)-N(7))-methyltransferase RlmK/23S rRNA (guanine(2445)-N(2))-methyltransferase RlmL [unclassified Pseudidiomarina]MDN7123694.1 bifunctional 23S rRNA (guanine(2069)-N(7))-methyltransferase RlmK/23S rRNA (guanine(2445)-N(2))-methyltransferase RlmL [Pseudidiomarina sp. 1APP75-32.1]MDN7128582.1 bifunctional 23S rRNA (guanine(2069)-N(7))-methyltransferase RlmK/23S rRNA (guanine(2445)-N(2))-methyltransferase RlmL [Pseudidiomarina sp. 1APR75-15]
MTSALQLFATCAKGLEPLLFDELQRLGIEDVQQTLAGCRFTSDREGAYRVCLWSRLASRVLLQLGQCPVGNDLGAVSAAVAATPWQEHMDATQSFVVDFTGQNQQIRHTQFGSQLVKDGIVDYFRDAGLGRPNVDKADPDLRINAHLQRDQLTWYLDLSGEALHKRGYRLQQGAAPLRETLAAAIAIRAGVTTDTDIIVDPFCGSGTLLIEAAMIILEHAPGLRRDNWGFRYWKQHQPELWQQLHEQAEATHRQAKEASSLKLYGSDTDPRVLAIADQNAERLDLNGFFHWQTCDATKVAAPVLEEGQQNALVICNPPYGERLGEEVETLLLYRRFGQRLRQAFQGWQVALLAGDEGLLKRVKMRSHKKYKLYNGALEVVLALYDLTKEQVEFTKEQSSDLANRLKKNYQKLEKWAAKEGVSAWRLYDADLPEYNAAVDVYNEHVVIQEYAAPKDIPPAVAKERLWFLLDTLAEELPFAAANMHLKVRQKQAGKQQYQRQQLRGITTIVHEYNAQFKINLSDYLDTGLFLDHRWARRKIAELSQNKVVLNLFAYTCSASVHAALGGALSVTSVDLSKTYLGWGEENFRLNGLPLRPHSFIQADCMQWLQKQPPQQRFDVIFLDPPTFSNSKRMQDVLDTQRDHVQLLKLAGRLLKDDGVIIFSTNKKKFKLDHAGLADAFLQADDWTQRSISLDFARHKGIHQLFKVTQSVD